MIQIRQKNKDKVYEAIRTGKCQQEHDKILQGYF